MTLYRTIYNNSTFPFKILFQTRKTSVKKENSCAVPKSTAELIRTTKEPLKRSFKSYALNIIHSSYNSCSCYLFFLHYKDGRSVAHQCIHKCFLVNNIDMYHQRDSKKQLSFKLYYVLRFKAVLII